MDPHPTAVSVCRAMRPVSRVFLRAASRLLYRTRMQRPFDGPPLELDDANIRARQQAEPDVLVGTPVSTPSNDPSQETMWMVKTGRRNIEGPYTAADIAARVAARQLLSTAWVCKVGDTTWAPWHEIDPTREAPPAQFDANVDAPPSLMTAAIALPAMAAFALLCQSVGFGRQLMWVVGMPLHEIGHSLMAWLGSRWMMPLPFISVSGDPISVTIFMALGIVVGVRGVVADRTWQTIAGTAVALLMGSWWVFGYSRNPVVFAVVLSVAVGSIWFGRRIERLPLVVFGAVLIAALLWSTLVLDAKSWDAAMRFAGVGGEAVLGALLASSWFLVLPPAFGWIFVRWPVALLGICTLVSSLFNWQRWSANQLPLGTAMQPRGDNGSDFAQLLNVHGWTQHDITTLGSKLAWASVVAVVIVYLWSLLSMWRERR